MTLSAPAATKPGIDQRRTLGNLLAAALFLLGPLVYVAPLSTAVLLPVTTIIAGAIALRQSTPAWGRIGWALAWWLPLFALMLASALWALDGRAALTLATRLILVIALGMALVQWCHTLPEGRLRPLLPMLAYGLILANLFVLADFGLGGALSRLSHTPRANLDFATYYGRGATIHAILLAPLGWGLWRIGAKRLAVAQFVLAAACILATHDLSAKVALAGAVGGGLLILALPQLRWAFLTLLALVALGLPLAFPVQLGQAQECWMFANKKSALHRVYIWDFVTSRIADKPLAGWGLDAARRMPGGQDTVALGADCPGAIPVIGQKLPLHPHNAILQTWLELGGLGIILGFGALVATLGLIYAQRRRVVAAVLVASSVAGTLVALVSYGVWQEWFLSALMLGAGVTAIALRQDELTHPPESRSV